MAQTEGGAGIFALHPCADFSIMGAIYLGKGQAI